jgi:hypothetical protein
MDAAINKRGREPVPGPLVCLIRVRPLHLAHNGIIGELKANMQCSNLAGDFMDHRPIKPHQENDGERDFKRSSFHLRKECMDVKGLFGGRRRGMCGHKSSLSRRKKIMSHYQTISRFRPAGRACLD